MGNVRLVVVAGLVALFSAVLPLHAAHAAGVHYVSTEGSDDNPGSRSAPFLTIGAAVAQATPGDLVVVAAGVYREAVVLTRSGAPGAPIVVRGLPGAVLSSPDPTTSLSAFDVAGNVSFVTVQGFELTGGFGEPVFVRPGAHDVELAGLHVHHNHTGIWIAGASDVVVRDTVLDHNFRTGVRVFDGARRIRIIDTRSEANDDGAGCAGDSDGFNADPTTSDVWFERATAIGNSEDGFDLQGPNMVVLQAVAQDNGCSGVKIAAGGYLENVLVERSNIGINVNAPAGGMTAVENSTLSQNDIGLRAIGSGHTLVLRNSIISGPGKALCFPSAVQVVEDHNLLYRPLPKDRLIVREDAGSQVIYSGNDVNAGRWQRDTGQSEGTAYGDPQLDPSTCRLRADSAAIDSGGAAGFAPVDLLGTVRPEGASVDRGAFEWVGTAPTLRVRRGVLHRGSTGSGAVRLSAAMYLPAGMTLDPTADQTTVVLRSVRGSIVRIDVSPDAWRRTRVRNGMLFRAKRVGTPGRAAAVTLRIDAGRATLRLTARAADVWAADAAGVELSVEWGKIRANAQEPATQVGETLYVLPCGGTGSSRP
jgi:hypothetical protein